MAFWLHKIVKEYGTKVCRFGVYFMRSVRNIVFVIMQIMGHC